MTHVETTEDEPNVKENTVYEIQNKEVLSDDD